MMYNWIISVDIDYLNEVEKENTMMKKTLYFLCTGNSCRSQMAEGWGREILGQEWNIQSAGIEAHGVNPQAIRAMKEIGIDISKQTSDVIDSEILQQADLVVTLCGDAADKCPVTPPSILREHWGFDDPAKAIGTEEEIWAEFQRVRDEIGERIRLFSKVPSPHTIPEQFRIVSEPGN